MIDGESRTTEAVRDGDAERDGLSPAEPWMAPVQAVERCEPGHPVSAKIEPALSAADWRAHRGASPQKHFGDLVLEVTAGEVWIEQLRGGNRATKAERLQYVQLRADTLFAVIAMANAALPPDDPRKITRQTIADLSEQALAFAHFVSLDSTYRGERDEVMFRVNQLIEALESYLPPEE
jgi:hypothetical protein